MSVDYETLRLIFWALLVLSIIGLSLCLGLVLGTAMLLTLAGKTDAERLAITANLTPAIIVLQAWPVTVIALLFAAWPIAYAVFFSSLQFLVLLMLPALICIPLGWYFKDAGANRLRRQNWDKTLTASGFLLSAMLGLICGNLLKGIPFHLDSDMRIFFLGDFWGLLNPFSLLLAAVSVSLFLMYGAAYLQMANSGEVNQFSKALVFKTGVTFLVLFALAGLWISRLEGYHITSEIFPNGVANPLNKFVRRGEGLWLDNYEHLPGLWAIPVLALIGGGATLFLSRINRGYWAFLAGTITVSMAVLTVAVSMFPFLLPSNRSLNSSLTIWDASSSINTLSALLWITAAAMPAMAMMSRWIFQLWREEGIRPNEPNLAIDISKNH